MQPFEHRGGEATKRFAAPGWGEAKILQSWQGDYPVALDYHENTPFAFNGKIHKIHIKYTDRKEPEIPVVPDD